MIEVNTNTGADGGLPSTEWVVCQSNPRTEIREQPVIWPLNTAADGNDLVLRKIKNAEPVVNFVGYAVVLPTQAEVPGEPACHFEIILNKGIKGAHANTVGDRKSSLYRGRRCAGQKRGQRGKRNPAAGGCIEVVIPEPAKLAAESERMAAMNPCQSVTVLERRIAPSLREAVNAAEVHHPGNHNRWEDRRPGCDSEILWIVFTKHVGHELDAHTVCSCPQLICDCRAEHMRVAQRQQIPPRRPEVAEPRQII